jgi:hypothetical protein
MRRRQQFPGRLAPQHVAPFRRREEIGRVRLPAFEQLDVEGAFKTFDRVREIRLKPSAIDLQRLGRFARAGIGGLPVELVHGRSLME